MYQGSNPDIIPIPNEDRMCLEVRPGYSIYFPFECDECSFYRLTGSPIQHENFSHKTLFTIYGAKIWIPFGIKHKERCITLLACFLKKLQQAKIWAFKFFQHH